MVDASNTCDASLSETEFEMVKRIIDIPDLEELMLSECSIYKVPYNIRKVNEEAYTPWWISIGPIHLSKEELKPMQEQKKRYFHFFWIRVSSKQAMRIYKHYLEINEEEIRRCYAEKFPGMAKEEFVDMMLLDAVFIMELLLRNCELKSHSSKHEQDHKESRSFRERNSEDLIMTQSWLSSNITRDLILLENQIPFFVLQKLYDDVVLPYHIKREKHASFVDLANEYFAFYNTQMSSSDENETKKPRKPKTKYSCCENPKHFTDLIRCFYHPSESESGHARHVLRTATKLQDSGVSFEKGDEKRRLLDITFDKTPILSLFLCFGCLACLNHFNPRFRIPQLKVDHNTECIFRILIVFEQCHYPEKPYICNYVSLIDSVIHTQLDVELLVEK